MSKAHLDVTEEILERVVYGMENQKDRLFLDPSDGLLHPESGNNDHFIPLPSWTPADGYRLMDGFAGSLPDTVFQKRLLDILHSGSGVFRKFKDVLKERPELERLWRRYKKREMRKTALSWLSRWSDALALESLGPEPDEWNDLSTAEFLVRNPVKEDWPRIRRWSQVAESEAFQESNPGEFSGAGIDDGEVVVAESPSGEIVGFSQLVIELVSGQREGRLVQVYVEQDFKGLGISEMLAGTLLKRAEDKGVKSLSARTEPSGRLLENFFENAGFSPVITWWRKTL